MYELPLLSIKKVTKKFGNYVALSDINFDVYSNETLALIGESGAGKSTLLRIIMGSISPSLGEIYINGQSAFSNQEIIHKTISYLPSEFTLFDFPKGSDFINLCAKLNNSSNKNALSLIKDFDLDVNANPKRMSKGMKQKTAIISTFMNDRDVYLLDEPSTGLDPLMREKLYNQILKLKDNSKTIIFTTNSYDEAMRLADKVLIISNGKILKTININDIKKLRIHTFKIKVDEKNKEKLKNYIYDEDDEFIYTLIEASHLKTFFKLLSNIEILGFETLQFNLENYVLHLLKGDKNEKK